MRRRILRLCPNTAAFFIIGSVGKGTWEKDSDLALVWVLRDTPRRKWEDEVEYDYSGSAELVTLK